MTVKTKRFDIVDYLEGEASIQEYFRQVLADGDSEEIVRALGVSLTVYNCIFLYKRYLPPV